MGLKIVAISDIHGYLPQDLPEGDILCICGDISPLNIQKNGRKMKKWLRDEFKPWANNLNYDRIIFITGNHDFVGEYNPEFMLDLFPLHEKVVYLCNSEFIYEKDGIKYKFFGTPYCPDLKNWAFYGTPEELTEYFNQIPNDVDILLSHCSPNIKNYGRVLQQCWNYGKNFGCEELRNAILEKKPHVVLSGHIHSGFHELEEIENIKYCNVSLLDENYKLTYEPLIFEYDR